MTTHGERSGNPLPIGVGIIGLSATRGWAATAHLPALRALPEYEVRALSAGSAASARTAAQTHGVPAACSDHLELVAREDVDLVVVTVKVPEHHRLVSAAIDAGKAVLCEWPLGNGVAEADDLAVRAAGRGVPAFVGLQARSAPGVRYVRELVADGAVGEILSTSLLGSGDRWGATVDATTRYLVDRDNGATLMTIPFGHTIDALCHVLGEFTELDATTATRRPSVRATDTGEMVPMTAADQVAVTGRLAGGAVLSAHYRGGRSTGTNFRWEIQGSEGDIVVRGQTGHLQYGRVEVLVTDRPSGALAVHPIPDRFHTTVTDPQAPEHTVAEAYARIAVDLRDGSRDAPTFADGVHRHRTLAAIEHAASTGQRQALS
jgi:predicted dehydrogenase